METVDDDVLTIDFPATLNAVLYMHAIYACSCEEEKGFPQFSVPERALLPPDRQVGAFQRLWQEFSEELYGSVLAQRDMEYVVDHQTHFRPLFSPDPEVDPIFHDIWESFYSWWEMSRTPYDLAVNGSIMDTIREWHFRNMNVRYLFLVFRDLPSYLSNRYGQGLVLPFERLVVGEIPAWHPD